MMRTLGRPLLDEVFPWVHASCLAEGAAALTYRLAVVLALDFTLALAGSEGFT